MKNEIIKLLVANICDDFSDIIIVGLDEEKKKSSSVRFTYSLPLERNVEHSTLI